MSDAQSTSTEHEVHEGPIKTPRQLILAVVFSFVVPILTIILLVNFVATGDKHGAGSDAMEPKSIAERIQPVAQLAFKDPNDVAALKTGEQVFKAQCTTCHTAGALGAPKFGDATAWAPRIKAGYEALLNSALHGKNSMPAQGGGEFSDYEIGRAVVYMVNNSGGHFDEPKAPAAAASGAAPAAAAAPAATPAPAPMAAPAAMAPAAAPAKAAATAVATAAPLSADAGKALFNQVCTACHTAGVAGAPKFGDKAAWAPRIAQGLDTLVSHAINGKNAMQPRGGAATASDAEIRAAVTYMVNAAK